MQNIVVSLAVMLSSKWYIVKWLFQEMERLRELGPPGDSDEASHHPYSVLI